VRRRAEFYYQQLGLIVPSWENFAFRKENRSSLIDLIPLVERVQNEFDAARDYQLVENSV
jgi:hypothetical protein